MIELYSKNTQISITLRGDGQELFEYGLPYPHTYDRQNDDVYRISYVLNGLFNTNQSHSYLNDILARLTLSMSVVSLETSNSDDNGIELSQFQGLKSIARAKNYEKVDNGQDNVFWSIKLYTEALIKESNGLVAYSLLESFALDSFRDRAKDKSTLKAKCRSIWNWYNDREWIIPTREGKGMSREEAGINAGAKNAEATKAKVLGAIEALKFLQEKINIANVAKHAGVSRNTAKKYLKEIGLI